MSFVHLHNHSHYSLLDGLPQIGPMLKRVKALGMKSVALTDHGAMYGIIEFYQEALKYDIKPIIGVETYVAPYGLKDKRPRIDDKNSHLTLIARDLEGYRNLMKLISIAHIDGFYYKPRVDHEVLKRYGAGLLALSGCLKGEVPTAIQAGHMDRAAELVKEYQNIFGEENFYLEMQAHTNQQQKTVNSGLKDLSAKFKVPLVATGDVHYLERSDAEAQDILVCVSTGKTVGDKDRMDLREFDLSLKSPQEMMELFKDTPEAVSNTLKVADKCNLEIPLKKLHFPKFDMPQGHTPDTLLRENSLRGLAEKYNTSEKQDISVIKTQLDPVVSARLDYELGIISQKGYSEYFLIVADFVNWSRSQGIITTTRGSAAGSIVSYSIGILNINPLDYKLPFERFLNPYRPSPPDIDLDIADNRRGEVIDYVTGKYGANRVAHIITFGTMMARAAARDVGRALGMPYEQPDRIAKLIPMGSQGFPMYLDRAKKETPELMKAYNEEPETRKLLDLAEKVEGCCRHASVHAAGIVIAPDDLTLYTPLQLDTDSKGIITQYEMGACESVGLVKMDFLGIRNLSILGEAIKIIEKVAGVKIDIEKLPLDDTKTYEMLARGETFGVFQLGGSGMTKYLVDLKPEKIFDIMAMIALYRPGPIDSIPDYIKRKNNPKLVRVLDPRMREILEMSYGIITFQDDVLLIAINIAGYTWEEADKLRKAMGKKIPEEMAKQKEKFIKGAIEKGELEPEKADKLFKLIEPFAAYGFNKAHAASYAHISYYTAYLKANFPVEYMTAVMTAESGDIEKIGEAIKECKRMNIAVLPPDINESFATFTVTTTKQIRFGLTAVKNVGEGVVNSIIEERTKNGPFKTLEDFIVRIQDKTLNKKTLESLSKAGAMEKFSERNQILQNMDALLNYGRSMSKAREAGQFSLFGSSAATKPEHSKLGANIKLTPGPEATLIERLKWEKELLGLYITEHPFSNLAEKLTDVAWPISKLPAAQKGSVLFVAGMITKTKKVTTKKGDAMMFCQLEDVHGDIELVIFPKIFFSTGSLWVEDKFLLVKGKVDDKEDGLKILVESATPIGEDNIDQLTKGFAQLKAQRAEMMAARGIEAKPVVQTAVATTPVVKIVATSAVAKPAKSKTTQIPAPSAEPGVMVKLPANFDQKITDQLRVIFTNAPGDKKVYVKILNSNQHRVETPFRVNFNDELKNKIETVTGRNSIELV